MKIELEVLRKSISKRKRRLRKYNRLSRREQIKEKLNKNMLTQVWVTPLMAEDETLTPISIHSWSITVCFKKDLQTKRNIRVTPLKRKNHLHSKEINKKDRRSFLLRDKSLKRSLRSIWSRNMLMNLWKINPLYSIMESLTVLLKLLIRWMPCLKRSKKRKKRKDLKESSKKQSH